MTRLLALACALCALLAAACATDTASGTSNTKTENTSTSGGGENTAADTAVKDEEGYLALVEEYKTGARKADNYVPMHDVVAGWQYWEITRTKGGGKVVEKWTVANVITKSWTAYVERDMGYYVLGYEVNLKISRAEQASKGNVKRAYIGRKGWQPREIEVGKSSSNPAPSIYSGAKAEAFEGVTMCKKEFYGTCYTWTEGGVEIKEWFADNGWFGKVIKRTEGGQTVFELSALATDHRAILDWKW
jgi:hypothetical protein